MFVHTYNAAYFEKKQAGKTCIFDNILPVERQKQMLWLLEKYCVSRRIIKHINTVFNDLY